MSIVNYQDINTTQICILIQDPKSQFVIKSNYEELSAMKTSARMNKAFYCSKCAIKKQISLLPGWISSCLIPVIMMQFLVTLAGIFQSIISDFFSHDALCIMILRDSAFF